MPNNGYFDSKRDNTILEASGFFCHACLSGKPSTEQSPDSRYCHVCYGFLLKEAEMLIGSGSHSRPGWLPKRQETQEKSIKVSQDMVLNMSTLNDKKSEVDIIQPSVAKVTREKRGPKQKGLPVEMIVHWAGEGMGSKAIATKLKTENSIVVSYKTIQRVLAGKRISLEHCQFRTAPF